MPRQIIVVDVESTGLGKGAVILEVAALNLDTGEEIYFVPYVTQDQLGTAEPDAMRINRYYERGVYTKMLYPEVTLKRYEQLRKMLDGNTFAASNPTFDTRLISATRWVDAGEYVSFGSRAYEKPFGQPWHYRLLDLSAYAAGVLALHPGELPGAHKVCELLGVENEEEHSALGDARATAECFRRLMAMNEGRVVV